MPGSRGKACVSRYAVWITYFRVFAICCYFVFNSLQFVFEEPLFFCKRNTLISTAFFTQLRYPFYQAKAKISKGSYFILSVRS